MSLRFAGSFFLLLFAAGAVFQTQDRTANHVVIVSIDGFEPDYYLHEHEFGVTLPNIDALRDSGSYAAGVVAQYPSLTFPSHTSMVTGVRPARHGVPTNTIFDPLHGSPEWYLNASAIKTPTLWQVAHEHGLTTGALSWPVTIGAEIDYLIPEVYPPPPRTTYLEYTPTVSTPGLFRAVAEKLSADIINKTGNDIEAHDRFIATAAVHIIKSYKPNLLLVHFGDTDRTQHDFGRHANEAHHAFERTDRYIGEIVQAAKEAGIRERTTFVITGDHGFYEVQSALQPNVVLRKAGLLRSDSNGRITEWKAATHASAIRLADPNDRETARRVTELLRNLSQKEYRGVFRIVERKELDKLGAYPEALLIIEPVEGYTVSETFDQDQFVVPTKLRGAHGYLPSMRNMYTGLILSGYGINAGIRLPVIRQLDIGPTAAALLGFKLKDVEGAVLPGVLIRTQNAPPGVPWRNDTRHHEQSAGR